MQSVSERVRRGITFPLSFIIFFSVLNGMMFQVAVPDISAEFGLLPSEASWVMTGYIVVFAVGSLIYGKLADIYSVRNLIITGLLLMNAGSLLGLFSKGYPMLIGARLMQAGGGAAIPALAMIAVTRYFPLDVRGRILGVIASTVALASGIGPVVGGFIAGAFNWRYMFLVSIVTVITIPSFRRILPVETRRRKYFDIIGAFLIGVGVISLLFFVTRNEWPYLLAGGVLIVWFAIHVLRAEDPFISPSLLYLRSYRNTLITTFLSIGTIFGMMFMVPIMLRDLNGLGADHIGLTMFPGAMSAVFMGAIGGRLSDGKGGAFVVYLGSILLVGGFLLLSTFAGHARWIIALNLIICYSGFSFLQSALPHTVSSVIPREQAGIGMGTYNLLFFISGAFSTAGIGKFLDLRSTGFSLNPLTSHARGWIYGNVFVGLAVIVAASALLFRLTFGSRK